VLQWSPKNADYKSPFDLCFYEQKHNTKGSRAFVIIELRNFKWSEFRIMVT